MFGETSKDYHEQVYFQSYLESYIRKMINGILKDLVDYESVDEFSWPEFNCAEIYNGYTNVEAERKFGFEFINKDQRIGYRYTNIDYDQIQELMTIGDVDTIKHVVWSRADNQITFCYDDKRVDTMNAFELFYALFCDLEDSEIRTMLGFTAQQTLDYTQALYEKKLVTYPRTDSRYLTEDMKPMLPDLLTHVKDAALSA